MGCKIQLSNWKLYEDDFRETYDPFRVRSKEPVYSGEPVTAMEALIRAGKISGSLMEDGEAEYCSWVADKSWLYACTFSKPSGSFTELCFDGLDTDCDIWLNGKKIAEHHTMYLPLRLPVTELLEEENDLMVYFYSPTNLMKWKAERMPEEWKGVLEPAALLRKAPCDLYRNYLGVTPYFTPVGFFGDIYLETHEKAKILSLKWDYTLSEDLSEASIRYCAEIAAQEGEIVRTAVSLTDPERAQAFKADFEMQGEGWGTVRKAEGSFKLEKPFLWNPVHYGKQYLYEASVSCTASDGSELYLGKQVGFRRIDEIGSLKFRVNGKTVRIWGGNIATVGSITHRQDPEKLRFLMDKAEECNCSALRVWGPGEALADCFYEEADRRGILIWQDFFIEPSQLPDDKAFQDLILEEARYLILRLKHHPSIFLWCGSNESFHMMDTRGESARIGTAKLLTEDFPALCLELDPQRKYHVSCPYGGEYANDPSVGDTHGSHCMLSFLPGEKYANFVSEHIVTFPPEMKSLTRFIRKEDLWPEGYSDLAVFGKRSCFPPALERRTNNFSQDKLGPIERFYDATDADSLIYKITAAAGYAYYHLITRLRRGKPVSDAAGPRRCSGYLSWKFNNTWPQFYCGLVDYYGECHIPFFDTKRAFAPVLLNFEVDDHVHLWGVNDTGEDVSGTVTIRVFRMSENRILKEMKVPAAISAGESVVITNLDRLGYFRKDCVLYASLEKDGKQITDTHEFVDMERHLPFPDARLTIRREGEELIITSDKFARCVELSGVSKDGEAFGWVFSDNYFDLLPFEEKHVAVSGRHKQGTIAAKAHYAQESANYIWE